MGWTSPSTAVTGTIEPAADWNTTVRDNLNFLATPPSVRVFNSAALAIATSARTAVTFDSERRKTDVGMHSTVTNTSRLVCTVAGNHLITGHVDWAGNATGVRQCEFRLNGVTLIAISAGPANAGGGPQLSVSTTWGLVVGDYVEMTVYQTSGGNLNVNAAPAYSPEASMAWIGF
jgi:hypothetical protein